MKWKVPVPSGLSSPIVAGDKLVITAFDGGKLYTIAYNRADGKEAWRAEAPAKQIEAYHKTEGSPAASTPATDGERIVSYFGSCGLFCYDLSGKELWKFEMPPAAMAGNFGSGVSPILADGIVVLVRDETKDSKILALDAATGIAQVGEEAAVPGLVLHAGRVGHAGRQAGRGGRARADDRLRPEDRRRRSGPWPACRPGAAPRRSTADGTLFFAGWSPGGPDDKEFQMPTFDALLKDLDKDKDGALSREEAEKAFEGFFDSQDANKDGKITRDEWDAILKFMAEGKNSAFALKAGGTGDVTKSHVLWKQDEGPAVRRVGDRLPRAVRHGEGRRDRHRLRREDGQGGVLRSGPPRAGRYYASPVAANGHIYFTSLDDGAVTVLKAGSDKPEVVAKNPKLGERAAATPAIADDTLYVRTEKHLYAFAEKK